MDEGSRGVGRRTFGLGTLCGRIDKPQAPHEHLTTARSMCGEMQMTFWRDQAEAALADLI